MGGKHTITVLSPSAPPPPLSLYIYRHIYIYISSSVCPSPYLSLPVFRYLCLCFSFPFPPSPLPHHLRHVHFATVLANDPSFVCTIITLAFNRNAAWTAALAAAS